MSFLLFLLLYLCTTVLYSIQASDPSAPLWSTYRPQVYFGLRARMPESPLFGIMWYDARNPQAFDHIRHECDQRDEMGRFGWSSHDGRNFGAQILQDDRSFVNLTTEFLRIQPSQEGEEILVRVQGKSIPEDADEVPIGFMYYWTLEDEDDAIRLRSKAETSGIAGPVDLEIDMGNMGKIQMQVVGDEENLHPEAFAKRGHRRRRHTEKLDKTNFLGIEKHLLYNSDDKLGDSMQMASRQLEFWNIKEIVREAMRSSWIQKYKDAAKLMEKGEPFDQTIYHALPNKRIKDPQAIVFQQILKTPFQMLFKFTYEREISSVSLSDNEQITRLFNEARFSFEQKFKFNFPVSEKHMALSQHAFSNLIGGVGYFEGKWLKAIKTREGVIGFPSGPNELLTAVPCRSFFPRGFLWDEGFHLLPIAKFDPLLAKRIVISWFELIDGSGWIAREQILGSEARSRVPAEFQIQHEDIANPPTLILAIEKLLNMHISETESIETIKGDVAFEVEPQGNSKLIVDGSMSTETELSFFTELYPLLKRNIMWYQKTQAHQDNPNLFSWKGRTRTHCLASGLDDFPRGEQMCSSEAHLDLHCWMATLYHTISRIALKLGYTEDFAKFSSRAKDIQAKINEIFWDSDAEAYFDVKFGCEDNEKEFVRHYGYVSLFPLMLKLIPKDSPHLDAIIARLRDPTLLWSDFGVRSLSKSDTFFGTAENYWRGPIWINMNFMILDGLSYYSSVSERAKDAFSALRNNLVSNLQNEYQRTGYLHEQYHPISGHGQRSKPFTGWTSLITLILAEDFQSFDYSSTN